MTIAFQNLFSDQTELGQLIRGTLLAAAATVEALAAAFKLLGDAHSGGRSRLITGIVRRDDGHAGRLRGAAAVIHGLVASG